MEYTVFKVEKRENYAVITFDRPDKFNAANAQIFTELAAAVKEMDADPDVGIRAEIEGAEAARARLGGG